LFGIEAEEAGDLHFDASPEGLRGLVVPSVDDASSHMFALGGDLVAVGGLFYVDGKLLVGLGVLDGAESGRHGAGRVATLRGRDKWMQSRIRNRGRSSE
jgi:hypothetical protein